MRVGSAVFLIAFVGLLAPDAAAADFVHVVAPGESLTSVAATDGLSVSQLAAANGLSPQAELIAGTGLQIPPQSGPVTGVQPVTSAAGAATSATGDGDSDGDDVAGTPAPEATGGGGSYVVQPGDTLTAIAARAGLSVDQLAADNGLAPDGVLLAGSVLNLSGGGLAPASGQTASSAGGSYVVQPGDTLTAIADRAGMSVDQLALQNGLEPGGVLLAGSVLNLSGAGTSSTTSAQTASAATQPVGAAAQGSPVGPPYPTPQTVTPSEVGSIAAANGVPPSLAEGIADQESGFNNAAVSSADARGVMQILPGTWNWIEQTLVAGAPPLAAASATDNVRGGVLLLRSLLNSTGDNAALAAAGYYQGLPSVEQYGEFPSTQQYVNDVMALANQYGGG